MGNCFSVVIIVGSICRLSFLRRQESRSREMKQYYVYILASKRNGTLYIDVTNDLLRRVWEHKNDLVEGFTRKYQVHNLVYYEAYGDIYDAIEREKRMKKWKRQWKINLIEKPNLQWRDLFVDLTN